MSHALRTAVAVLALPALAGGCAHRGRADALLRPVTVRASDAGFDDRLLVTDAVIPDAGGPEVAQAVPVVPRGIAPGFTDEVRIEPEAGARPFWQPGAEASGDAPRDGSDREDTDLGRSRAQRRGQGGGPTRSEEEENDLTGEPFKSDLLVRALGLDDSPYQVFGWLQGSFTGNPANPRSGVNFGVNPNFRANRFLFQELFLSVGRPLDPEQDDAYGFGFRLDNLFGTDWNQYHMVGLLDDLNHAAAFGYEPIQFYGEVHLPWLSPGGVDVKAGRFFSLAGYEDFLAPGRPLNSGSYLFGYAQPFTHVGVMTTWHAADRLNVFNGAVNGWDRWLDANFRWGYAGGAVYDSADGRTNVTGTLYVGPIQFPFFFPRGYPFAPNGVTPPPYLAGRRNPSYGRDNAVFFSGILIHEWDDGRTIVVETDEGFEANVPDGGAGGGAGNAAWYGLAAWYLRELSGRCTGVYRAEAFRDANGVRTGFADTYYEMTLGLILKPRSWFWVRPEVRGDWAVGAPPYDGGTRHGQLTLGFDTMFLF